MRFLRSVLVVSALLSVACEGYKPPAAPSVTTDPATQTPGAQARLVLLASSRTDQQLDVYAQVLDAKGLGIPNVDVQFAISGGTVTPPTVKTDVTGTAKAIAVASGTATLTATTDALRQTATVIGGATALSVNLFISSVTVGTASSFSASVTGNPIGGAFKFAYTYGDAQSEDSASSTITHTYAQKGTYNASVKVTDGSGRTATAINTAVVNDVPVVTPPTTPTPTVKILEATLTCTAAAHGTPSVCNIAATYGGSSVASNAVSSVTWDWGDGTNPLQVIANSPLASHNYLQAGTYLVTATVTAATTDGSKTAAAVSKSITVN